MYDHLCLLYCVCMHTEYVCMQVCVLVCVHVYVCVRERGGKEKMCVCVCVFGCVYVIVW